MKEAPLHHPIDCNGEHHHLPDEHGYECSTYPGAVYLGVAPTPYRGGHERGLPAIDYAARAAYEEATKRRMGQ